MMVSMLPPTDPSFTAIAAKLQEAVTCHNQGQLQRAQRIYEEILRVEPRHFDALHLLGVIAAASADPSKALDLIDRAIQLNPGNPMAHNNRGAALLDLGLWEAALLSFDRAIGLKEDYAQAHYNRGNALKELKRWEAALTGFDRAIALEPDFAEAHSNRGFVLHELRRLDESLASCNRAIALKP